MEDQVVAWYENLLTDFADASFQTFQQTEDIHSQALAIKTSIAGADGMMVMDKLRLELLSQSKIYRSHLRVLLAEINNQGEILDGENAEEKLLHWLENQHDLVSQFHQSWYLIEIFILNPARFVSVDFAAWLQDGLEPLPYEGLFAESTHPELAETYWPTIYQLAMRGSLDIIYEALQRHSEIALTLQGQKNGRQRFASSLDRTQCQALLNLFTTHPYLQLLPKVNDVDLHEVPMDSNALADWKQRVASLIESSLTIKIPELDILFRILLGEQRTLGALSSNNWMLLTLSQLLFTYPSIMARSNLCRVVEESIQATAGDNALFADFRNIMMGSVAKPIESLVKIANNSINTDLQVPEIRIVCLLTIAHLSRLLIQSSNSLELLEPMKNGTSFYEELVIAAAVSANEQKFPIQFVYGYLVACHMKGGEVLREVLPKRKVETDEEAIEIANALRMAKFHAEARKALTSRGMQLLSKNIYPHFRRSIADNAFLYENITLDISVASSMGDAARFFQFAGQYNMLLDLMDCSLFRCMHAVRMYNEVFDDLLVFPGPLVDSWTLRPLRRNDPTGAAIPFLTADELESQGKYYEDDRNTLFEDIWPRDGPPSYRRPTGSVPVWNKEQRLKHLQYALQEATSIVNVLDDVVESHWLKYPAVFDHLQALKKYSRAISSVVRVDKNEIPITISLRESANMIHEVIFPIKGEFQPRINIRYWLHLLDLALWFHRRICQQEMWQSLDPLFVQSLGQKKDGKAETMWCKGVYSKDQSQHFVDLLKAVDDSEVADFIFAVTATTSQRRAVLFEGLMEMCTTMSAVYEMDEKEKNRFPERVAAVKSKSLHINLPSSSLNRFGNKKSAPTIFASPLLKRGGAK